MYDDHIHHIRGDRVAGTGLTYECLWRARLMLKLDKGDRLVVFRGEDVRISKPDHTTSFYQIKHSVRALAPGELATILALPRTELASDDTLSYFLCTNAPLSSPEADSVLAEMSEQFPGRFAMLTWAPDTEDPAARIRDDLFNLIGRLLPPSSRVIRLADVALCCERLLALEATFKLAESPAVTGETVWQRVGIPALLLELPGRVFGSSVVHWPQWVMRAHSHLAVPGDPVFAATHEVALGSRAVSTSSEEELAAHVSNWLASPPGSRVVLISLPSGCGKTWLLLRLAHHFSEAVPTYWVDTVQEPDLADLEAITAWLGRPALLLVDDLFEQEWESPVASGLRAHPPLLVVATTSTPVHAMAVAQLRRRVGAERLVLPDLKGVLSRSDWRALVASLRNGLVSRSEERDLRQTNLRHATQVLETTPSRTELSEVFRSLWRHDEQQAWVVPLLLCSSLGVRLPLSLLRDCARAEASASRELPDDLSELVLRARRGDEQWVWIEDSEIAAGALALVAKDIGQASLEAVLLHSATLLMGSVAPERAAHRGLARRLTREFVEQYPSLGERLLEGCRLVIPQILEHEHAWALAYVWLPLLPEGLWAKEGRRAAERLTAHIGAPDSVSEVLLLVDALGGARVAALANQALAGARSWPVEPWARFVEHLRPLTPELKRELLRRTCRLLQHAPVPFRELIDRRNVGVELLTGVEDFGSAHDREWLVAALGPLLSDGEGTALRSRQNRLMPKYLDLTDRVLMQSRHGLSIIVAGEFCSSFEKRSDALPSLLGRTYDEYRVLFEKEVAAQLHMHALALGRRFAVSDAGATQRHQLWTKLLSFAEVWAAPADWRLVRGEAYRFLSEVMPYVGSGKLFEACTLRFARSNVSRHIWEPADLRLLLQFVPRMTGDAAGQLLVLIAAALAQQGTQPESLRDAAKRFTWAVCGSGGRASPRAERLWVGLARWLEVDVPPAPMVVDQFDEELAAPIVIDLLTSVRHCGCDETEAAALAKACLGRWATPSPFIQLPLFLTLLALGAPDESRRMLEVLLRTPPGTATLPESDLHCLAGAWEARFGDVAVAAKHLSASLKAYERLGSGAHPPNASRSYRLLGSRLPAPANQILGLCAELTHVGPLRSPDDAMAASE